jgi:hypothetical protein
VFSLVLLFGEERRKLDWLLPSTLVLEVSPKVGGRDSPRGPLQAANWPLGAAPLAIPCTTFGVLIRLSQHSLSETLI